jgi:hypothetical protein
VDVRAEPNPLCDIRAERTRPGPFSRELQARYDSRKGCGDCSVPHLAGRWFSDASTAPSSDEAGRRLLQGVGGDGSPSRAGR